MPMTTDLRLKWAAALRSGEYNQGKGTLCRLGHLSAKPQYCCLGVLAQIEDALEEGNNFAKRLKGTHYSNALTNAYLDKWGLSLAAHDKFIHTNDTLNWTFHQIADAVEAGNILGVEI